MCSLCCIRYSWFISTTYFSRSIFFYYCTILHVTNILTSNSNHIIYINISIAIACGAHICIEKQPYNSDTRDKRIKSNSLTTAASSVSGSLHVVCSIALSSLGVLRLQCHPFTVHHQPFNKLHINQYSLSSYDIPAWYRLHIFHHLFVSSAGLF